MNVALEFLHRPDYLSGLSPRAGSPETSRPARFALGEFDGMAAADAASRAGHCRYLALELAV